MRADILLTTKNGQIRVGTITQVGTIFRTKMKPGYERIVRSVLTRPISARPPCLSAEELIDKRKDPEAWMRALPWNYDGTRLRVALKED
jgi:hypothetical protein